MKRRLLYLTCLLPLLLCGCPPAPSVVTNGDSVALAVVSIDGCRVTGYPLVVLGEQVTVATSRGTYGWTFRAKVAAKLQAGGCYRIVNDEVIPITAGRLVPAEKEPY